MRRDRTAFDGADTRGFTLVELLVAVTLLGIIMVAIGAMITTAFRTTTIVSDRLNASRAPKLVSTYWVPDVEGAMTITQAAGGCGVSGGTPLVTFEWDKYPSQVDADAPNPDASKAAGSSTWALATRGTRTQVIRSECANGTVTKTATVVPDVGADSVQVSVDRTSVTVTVNVPDRNEPNKQFHFSVDATQTVTTSVPST